MSVRRGYFWALLGSSRVAGISDLFTRRISEFKGGSCFAAGAPLGPRQLLLSSRPPAATFHGVSAVTTGEIIFAVWSKSTADPV
jgi:hypothetical protein